MRRLSILLVFVALSPAAARAQALDYEFFKTRVQPVFLDKRPGHTRCVVCHSGRSNNAFHLEPLAPGSKSWTEEQSRRNFGMASRLVVPGDPQASAYHSGGRQFASRDDPQWKILSQWARGKPN
jgi:hypothetical protein